MALPPNERHDRAKGQCGRAQGLSAPRSDAMAQARHGLQDSKMKSPHAAVLGPHAGQVERIMRRHHAVDQTLPRAIPARLKQY